MTIATMGRRMKKSAIQLFLAVLGRAFLGMRIPHVADQDCDLVGTSWYEFAKRIFSEVIVVGRGGTLVDWCDSAGRAAVTYYAAEDILNKKSFALFDAISAGMMMKKALNLSWKQFIQTAFKMMGRESGVGGGKKKLAAGMRFAVGSRLFYKATIEGDVTNGILVMGQTVGRIHDIPTVAEVIERTVTEAKQILAKMNSQIAD